MPDLTGHYFSGYKLEERLKTDEMASIYKAFDKTLSRWVTVKLFSTGADLTGEAQAIGLARFWQEAKTLARLRHPNISTVYDYGEEDGWAYLVIDYVPGGSLQDRLQSNQPFSWQQALNLIIPVAQALAFAHEQGIIHRDVKPANILLPTEDWPLLAGFGLAKIHDPVRANLTSPSQITGVLTYAAPEQIEGGSIDARADIYSLGLVLYELLSGSLPFQEGIPFERLARRLNNSSISLAQARSEVPTDLVSIVERALAQAPNERYSSMAEFRDELIKVQDEFKVRRSKRRSSTQLKIRGLKETTGWNGVSIRLKVNGGGREIVIADQTELIIGRAHRGCRPDIDMEPYQGSQAGVSRQHSRLLYQGGGWFVEDLDSTNGTFVNGVKVTPRQMMTVKNGDVIHCGRVALKLGLE